MQTISDQQSIWSPAFRPTAPRVGSHVRIDSAGEGPGTHEFIYFLQREGLKLGKFIRHMPRLRLDVYRIEKA